MVKSNKSMFKSMQIDTRCDKVYLNTLNVLTCMEYKKSKDWNDWNSETVTLITYVNGDIEDIHWR